MRLFVLVTLLTLMTSFRTSDPRGPADINGQLKVCGRVLCNSQGKPVQLRGLSTHGLQWYGWDKCVGTKSLQVMKEWGVDVVRVAVYPREGGFKVQPEKLMRQVVTIIDECTRLGLYVIVDWHQRKPGDPNLDINLAKLFFTFIAKRYANATNVLYEICNEPNGVPWIRIKKYADEIIPVIRKYSSNAVVLVGTPGWSSFGIADGSNSNEILRNKIEHDNIMYAFHFYAKTHREQYLQELAKASEQIPVFVTEFGFQEASGDGVNDADMAKQYIGILRSNKISWVYWNFSDDVRTGAIWTRGTCEALSFDESHMKPSGLLIKTFLRTPKDDF